MELQVVIHKALNEIIAVIIAGVFAQRQRLPGLPAGLLKQRRVQLAVKLVIQTLINQDFTE